MLLKLKYEDVKASGVRGEVNGKNVNFFMVVEVNESNIVEAIEKCNHYKGVVAFNYVGQPSFLPTIELKDKPVIITKEIEKLDLSVDFIMNDIDPRVRVEFVLPKDYSDMRAICEFSKKFPNLRVTGGKFLRLDGCNIGSILREDIPKKIADSRIPMIVEGNGEVYPVIDIEDLPTVEYYEYKASTKEKKPRVKKEKAEKPKSKSKARPKKQLSSLLSLVPSTDGFDNF